MTTRMKAWEAYLWLCPCLPIRTLLYFCQTGLGSLFFIYTIKSCWNWHSRGKITVVVRDWGILKLHFLTRHLSLGLFQENRWMDHWQNKVLESFWNSLPNPGRFLVSTPKPGGYSFQSKPGWFKKPAGPLRPEKAPLVSSALWERLWESASCWRGLLVVSDKPSY